MIQLLGWPIVLYAITLATLIVLGILRERKKWLVDTIESRLKTDGDRHADKVLRSAVEEIFSGKQYKVIDSRFRFITVDNIDIEPTTALVVYCKTDESILSPLQLKLNSLFDRNSNYTTYCTAEYRNPSTIAVFYISAYKKDIYREETAEEIKHPGRIYI